MDLDNENPLEGIVLSTILAKGSMVDTSTKHIPSQ